MKNIEELHKLCDKVMDSIAESNRKLDKEAERLTAEDARYLESLTRILKSVTTVIAMEEYPEGGSGEYPDDYSGEGGWNYNRPYMGSYYGTSGARRMRDSMGRYTSSRGYR